MRISYPDAAQKVQYRYDLEGRRASLVDGRGTTAYGYDAYRPLLASVADPVLGTTAYQYDARGNRTRITYPTFTGVTLSPDVDYTYLAGGHLKEVKAAFLGSGGAGGLVGTYQYDDAGRQSRLDLHGGAYTTWSYDALGQTSWPGLTTWLVWSGLITSQPRAGHGLN